MKVSVTLPIEDDIAQAFTNAAPEDQRKFQTLVEILMREFVTADQDTLSDLMDSISDKAQARGLTEEILAALLNDDD